MNRIIQLRRDFRLPRILSSKAENYCMTTHGRCHAAFHAENANSASRGLRLRLPKRDYSSQLLQYSPILLQNQNQHHPIRQFNTNPLHFLGTQKRYLSTEGSAEEGVTTGEFVAETRRLLEIVAESLYSDKEVFVRELISNSSDAMEKLRQLQVTDQEIFDKDLPLEITISCDKLKNTLTIEDTGVGMTFKELTKNLGTIAHSGTKEFMETLKSSGKHENTSSLIGRFGVGFYSVFMVAKKVHVYSKSAVTGETHLWESEGHGKYQIRKCQEELKRGTKLVIYLKENCDEFSQKETIESVLKKYSNFISFPLLLNGKEINVVKPLWMMKPDEVNEEKHNEFYKFITNSGEKPLLNMHFVTDIPISIRSLMYVPSFSQEKIGLTEKVESGLNLFSRRVLIQAKSKYLLPEWLRFVKGVVDSEDIPINLSRELLQNSTLISKIKNTLTKKVIKWFYDVSKDKEKYKKFWDEFGTFIEEGILTDGTNREKLSYLVRYESSASKPGELVSLQEYVSRKKVDQKRIYYICAPSRQVIESSPYMEQFNKREVEVLYGLKPYEEMIFQQLGTFEKLEFFPVEREKLQMDIHQAQLEKQATKDLSELIDFLKSVYGNRVSSIQISLRLESHAASISDRENAMIRRMRERIEGKYTPEFVPHQLEINPRHPIILKLNTVLHQNVELAKLVANQILDNALLASGILDNTKGSVERWNDFLEHALDYSNVWKKSSSKNEAQDETIKEK